MKRPGVRKETDRLLQPAVGGVQYLDLATQLESVGFSQPEVGGLAAGLERAGGLAAAEAVRLSAAGRAQQAIGSLQ